MTDYGVTDQGFVIKPFEIIKQEIEAAIRLVFGDETNTEPESVWGQFIGIMAERESLIWEYQQGVYNAFYPDTAAGVNLDGVVALTGITRLAATYSTGTLTCYGTLGTTITQNSEVSVLNSPNIKFIITETQDIGAGTDEIQLIEFSEVPTSGLWSLIFDGEETADLAFNANAIAVQNALNALNALNDVTVSGNYTDGFVVTFTGTDGQKPQPMIQAGNTNTLDAGGNPVTLSFTETQEGELPNVDVAIRSSETGAIQAISGTITVIDTPISGWDSCINKTDVDLGRDVESDSDLLIRRRLTLAAAGAGTPDAIRAEILDLDDVVACVVRDNKEMIEVDGMPPKSFQAVVLGGDDQDIGEAIWDVAPAGIESYGSEMVTVVDSQGNDQDVFFSRPDEVPIYLIVTLTVDSDIYPAGGDDAVKAAIIEYAESNFSIGDDVITSMLYCPVHSIQGILDIQFDIGTSEPPSGDANITIAIDEISTWDTSRITIIS